jgi:hypothetical protein
MAGMRAFVRDAPDEVNVSATWWSIPAVPSFPEELHGRAVIILGAVCAGPAEDGEKKLRPLREIADTLLDLSGVMPYTGLQQMFDPFFPAGELRYYWKSIYLSGLKEEVVQTIARHVAARPSKLSMAGLWTLGGALGRVDAEATATGSRDAPYLLEILANWDDPAATDVNIAWARAFFEAMEPHSTGKTNVNFPGTGDDREFGRAAFGVHWNRLSEIKKKYDPTNLFRLNQNIEPQACSPDTSADDRRHDPKHRQPARRRV